MLRLLLVILLILVVGGDIMPHGTPDWGSGSPQTTVYAINDMAELAVRLGSPAIQDRRGNVVFMEDFEKGVGIWSTVTSGTGSEVKLVVGYGMRGRVSARLTCGSTAGAYAALYRRIEPVVPSLVGLEASLDLLQGDEEVIFRMQSHDGTYYSIYYLKYDHGTGKLYVRDETQTYQEIGDIGTPSASTSTMLTIKLVVDMVNYRYYRVIVSGREYDASAIDTYKSSSSYAFLTDVFIGNYRDTASSRTVVVDNVIVTQNEPE